MNRYVKALNFIKGTLSAFHQRTNSEVPKKENEWLSTLEELVEKATPMKGVWKYDNFGDGTLCCPNCKKPIVNVWSKANYKPNYCHYCGQALDWSYEK